MTKRCLRWYLCCFLACMQSYPLLRFVTNIDMIRLMLNHVFGMPSLLNEFVSKALMKLTPLYYFSFVYVEL